MKSYYSGVSELTPVHVGGGLPSTFAQPSSLRCPATARIAVYEAPGAAPRVEEVAPAPVAEFIESIAARVHQLTGEAGGSLPYTVVREVTENLIHAGFAEPVISIMDGGSTVRFADQGPGIPAKDRAVLPGYTTADSEMKAYIRGVGSGLPIVRDFLSFSGGALVIEDNLGCGSVVTISSKPPQDPEMDCLASEIMGSPTSASGSYPIAHDRGPSVPRHRLTTRQTQVLALVLESGSAGPSLVSRELGVGLSTAYRDLALLEDLSLIEADGGKRKVTHQGLLFLDNLTTQ